MLFNSLQFLIFFPIVFLLYYVIPTKFRYLWLLVSSYYFYMCWNPKYLILIFLSTGITYLSGILIGRGQNKKLWVALSFTLNLFMLFFFKYFNFTLNNINRVLCWGNQNVIQLQFDILLPVGISFYTFQALSYTMDVYRGEIQPQKNFFKYALFVSFFPQLVAGPIERSKNLLSQVDEVHVFDQKRVEEGLLLMAWGFFEKLVISDRVAIIVNQVYNNYANYQGITLAIATILFSIQIYCDFCGYSDIARGAAKVLGFRLTKNFRCPYFSRTIVEFWKRWHITLTSWFRDYLYIPMGGNRKGKLRKYVNIMIVFSVSGLWHGANWTFVVWGVLNGLYQIVGEITCSTRRKLEKRFHFEEQTFGRKLFQILVTFLLVNSTWVFFRAESIHQALTIIRQMLTVFNPWVLFDGTLFQLGLDKAEILVGVLAIIIKIICSVMEYYGKLYTIWESQGGLTKWILTYGLIVSIIVFGIYGSEYDSGQFIYFQF